jgi:GNAT superfamily N-acetyltransferase
MAYYKATQGENLAGVVALRDNAHLYHLFVAPAFQGQGLSRMLWEHARGDALSRGNTGAFTVNATPYAVPVYERFGFQATGPRVETKGIAFVPMHHLHSGP